ncbi:hypothetical protein ACFQS7_27880 [Dankookia sp. GCM10030260]|uniref:hypothetical protein n=1 Tax=Dankookia sp. GCM10030260 TaxID=3273390 RepID=UPI003611763D
MEHGGKSSAGQKCEEVLQSPSQHDNSLSDLKVLSPMTKTVKSTAPKLKRVYTDKTLKIIFALSRNECAHPDCSKPIISPATAYSGDLVVGQIAHIYALNGNGPRSKVGLTQSQLNQPSNLILLCPTDHVIVDGQHETYPASMLIEWKSRHEMKFANALSRSISDVGAPELEVAAKSLMSSKFSPAPGSLLTVPPQAKIVKNGLGSSSELFLSMGAAKSHEVEVVLLKASQLDADFPDRLREGFVLKYQTARQAGYVGDELFAEVLDWATGGSQATEIRKAAGICVLAHLFIICDVFEK